jgi:UDP-N-acetylmuramoyl-tripeptide--D-alanyl-D-alanine ligase
MNPFWNTRKIAEVLNLESTAAELPIQLITTDSRAVIPGCLFVAIKGDSFDGHDFIPQAIEKGAVGVITEKDLPAGKAQIFKVPSSLTAIRTLAHHYRKQFKISFVGVVGAVGKTTTKELISSLLTGRYQHILKTEGSQNGFLGIPITLLSLKPEDQIAVIEIGIDDIGAMEQHLALVEPTHTILTAIGPEHLHQLKTVDIAAEEELKAFDYSAKKNLPMAINVSDEYVSQWFQKHQFRLVPDFYQTYSLHASHNPHFLGQYRPEKAELTVKTKGWTETFNLPLPGEHHAHNLLAAITLGSILELTPTQMKTGLAHFKTAYGRTEIHSLNLTDGKVEVIGDYYNSNPTSAVAALKLLTEVKSGGKTHAVLADMLELGDGEEGFHRELATSIIGLSIGRVWLYGPRMKWLQDELKKRGYASSEHFSTHDDLIRALKTNLHAGERVLIKGSRGMKMETVLKGLMG